MNLSENVYEICEMFMKDSQHVWIEKDEISFFCKNLKTINPPKFEIPTTDDIFQDVLIELVGSSINYCYWHGKSSIKPNNLGSTKMGELVNKAFKHYQNFDCNVVNKKIFDFCIDKLINSLILNRFPLLEERIKHLKELKHEKVVKYVDYIIDKKDIVPINTLMIDLITSFPGFASDIFLKRAILFFTQLYRKFGWFKDQLDYFFLPSDYQIPKMLYYNNCIVYENDLEIKIENNKLIPKGSLIEHEIRAASILAVKEISKTSGWNVCDIDTYLFLNRKDCSNKFHLAITTDY